MKNCYSGIGTQKESCLHRQLKMHYTQDGGINEIPIKNYICDIKNPGGEIIEIQTKQLSSLEPKLRALLPDYKVTVIHPIAADKFIQRTDPATGAASRRKSPRHGTYTDIFAELTKIYPLLFHRNFTLKVVLIKSQEKQIADGTGSWRRHGNRIADRELLEIIEERNFTAPQHYLDLLPSELPRQFTVADLKQAGFKYPGKTVWLLKNMKLLSLQGKKGRAYLYERTPGSAAVKYRKKAVRTAEKVSGITPVWEAAE